MEYIAKNIPLWQVTTWDKKFNNVDRAWQPKTIKYNYLLSDELDEIRTDDGDVRILYTGKDVGYTTESLAGDNLSEGEIVSIPWGGIPTVKYYKGKFVTGDNRIATSNDVSKLSNRYLYYFMKGHIHEIASYYRGASLKHPCMKDVLKMEISYPSIEIQNKICDQFDVIESVIEQRSKELTLFDDLIKARFVELFGDPVEHLDNGETVRLDTIADRITVGFVGEASNDYVDDGVPYLRTQNVRVNHIDLSGLIYVTESFHQRNEKSIIHPGDVVISRVGVNRGMAAVIPDSLEEANIANCLIVGKTTNVNPFYLAFYMNMSFGKRPQFGASVGSAQGVVNTSILKKWEVYLPTKDLQEKFYQFAKQIDKSKVVYA